jgi:hypothetical protein
MTDHTPTPWEVAKYGKALYGAEGRIVLSVSATVTCGRVDDDYYSCRNASAKPLLYLSPENAAFIVKAVNNHDALVKALQALIDILEGAQSGFIPLCGSDLAWQEGRDRRIADARAVLASVGSPVTTANKG